MEQKAKSIMVVAITLATLGLAGFVGVSYAISADNAAATHYPNNSANHYQAHEANDRANHHPVHVAN